MPRSTKKGVNHRVALEDPPKSRTGPHMEDTRAPRVQPGPGGEAYKKKHSYMKPVKVKQDW